MESAMILVYFDGDGIRAEVNCGNKLMTLGGAISDVAE